MEWSLRPLGSIESVVAEASREGQEEKGKKKGFVRGTGHLREQGTRPDLLRLTRHALQVAELLPWPVKGVLYQVGPRLTARETRGNQVFWRGRS